MLKKLLPFILPYLIEFGLDRNQAPKRFAIYAAFSVFLMIAAIFGLISLHEYLTMLCGSIAANAYFAAGFALIAVIILGIGWMLRKKKSHSLQDSLNAYAEIAKDKFEVIKDRTDDISKKHGGKILVGVAIAAMLFGKYSRRKK